MNDRIRHRVLNAAKRIKPFCVKHKYSVLITAGALMALPFCIGELFFLTYFSLALFYFYLTMPEKKKFRMSFAFFSGFYLSAYHWFTALYPIDVFNMTPFGSVCVIIALWFGISAIHALITSLIVTCVNRLSECGVLMPFALSALWVIDEWLLGIGGFAFPWARLVMTQYSFLPFVQTVSLFGSFIITLVVCVSSFCAAEWIRGGKKIMIAVALSFFLLNTVCGTVIYLVPRSAEQKYEAAVVQGNVGTSEKWIKDNIVDIHNTYVDMTRSAASKEGVKLVLLPESAIPVFFVENGIVHNALAEIAREYDVTVMFGSLYQENGCYYNSVFTLFPDGTKSDRYDKQKLVPMIEGLPYDDVLNYSSLLGYLPFFSGVDLTEGIYKEGNGTVIAVFPDGTKASPAVCFDSAFPSVSRDAAADGATLLTAVSNDSWYHDGQELYQHVKLAALRSVETGRYTVRAANTGISCIIDDKGRILSRTDPLTKDVITCEIGIIETKTLYTVIGDVPLYISLMFVFFLIIKRFYHKFKKTV